MSGGSYEYLCFKDSGELLSGGNDKMLQSMADRLSGLGYANDAAKETQELLQIIKQSRDRLDTIRERLSPLWRAIEWWDSCDSGEDDFKKVLNSYRE